jgi:glycine cleavage system regulatory protein
MRKSLVLTIIGTDRTGLVESVARTIEKHQGNWVESRMARLAGKFAGVLRLDVDIAAAAKLAEALDELKTEGLTVVVHSSDEPGHQAAAGVLHLELVGHDRPGIVRQVAGALAHCSVNVDELASECFSAPMSGEPMFKISAKLRVPQGTTVEQVEIYLEELAREMGLDISLTEHRIGESNR